MRRPLACAIALVAGCGAAGIDGGPSPDGPSPACEATLIRDRLVPEAGDEIRMRAVTGSAPGVFTYQWTVTRAGAPVAATPAQPDNSEVLFTASPAGVYAVTVDVSGPGGCLPASQEFNVRAKNANALSVQLRVTPPPGAQLPPIVETTTIYGGADFTLGVVAARQGDTVTGQVRSGASGVPAYLRFASPASPHVAVEAFANASGAFIANIAAPAHVLVIPQSAGLAPRQFALLAPVFEVDAGVAVAGTVLGPGGAPLEGALVQLDTGLAPSTIAATAADGAFALRVDAFGGAISVDATPPNDSGLPRLTSAATAQLDLGQPVQVRYAGPAPVLRDLAGTIVRRGGVPLGAAHVVFVARVDAAGTIGTGGAPVPASGVIRIAATTNAAGALPSIRVPARAIAVVVEAGAAHAIASIDLSSSAPAIIELPPAAPITTQLRTADGAPAPGAILDAIPAGDLALAGVTSAARATAGPNGDVTVELAAGARYDFHVRDPLLRRGALGVARSIDPAAAAASYALSRGVIATGRLELNGAPVGGAAIQIFSGARAGDLPLAEGVTEPDGRFALVVPDPGTTP